METMALSTSLAVLSLLFIYESGCGAFTFKPISVSKRTSLPWRNELPKSATVPPLTIASMAGSSNSSEDNDNDATWQVALKQRQLSLEKKRSKTRERWLSGEFEQTLVSAPDWVRRVAVQWPFAACGSAGGDIYVIQCGSGKVLGRGKSVEDQRRYVDVSLEAGTAKVLEELFGQYDGGGTLAIGMSWNNIISHAGRNGGVEFWEFDITDDASDDNSNNGGDKINDLKYLGSLLDDVLVTSLDWTEDVLWIGTQDGRVLAYNIDMDESDEELEPNLLAEWKNLGGTVLSLKGNEELDVAVATTSSGLVTLLSTNKPGYLKSFKPPFESKYSFPLCTIIVEIKANKFSIVCGGSDGSIFNQPLKILDGTMDTEVDLNNPFKDSIITRLLPNHEGRCKSLVSPFAGIVLSGGQDGTIRLWNMKGNNDEKLMYLLGGFKVWLGSLWTDGERVVSDGADNSISILKFAETGDDE